LVDKTINMHIHLSIVRILSQNNIQEAERNNNQEAERNNNQEAEQNDV
jgi:hypothetical protein